MWPWHHAVVSTWCIDQEKNECFEQVIYWQARPMQPRQQIRIGQPSGFLASKHVNKNMGLKTQSWGCTQLNLETRKNGNMKQSDGYIMKSWGHKQEADQSKISVRWSKWFREARTANHSFSSISFQRLTKIARHFKLLSVPVNAQQASQANFENQKNCPWPA